MRIALAIGDAGGVGPELAAKLLADDGPLAGGRLMIVGEEIDREAAHTIRYAVPRARVIELQGRLTRLQTAAALSKAELYVGADSIWTQLAVAAGTPVIAVFGPSDETVRGPWRGVAVRGPPWAWTTRVPFQSFGTAIQ